MSKHDEKPDRPAATKEGDEPFLKRWSRMKSGEEAEAPEPSVAVAEAEEGALVDPQGDGDVPAIDPADLPDVESLGKDSDYTVFMQEGVPDALRNLALRKLFASNPALAVLDGLNDYDEDYSKLGIVTQTVKTAYKVGRGFLEDEDLVNIDEVDETDEIDAIDETEEVGDEDKGDEDKGDEVEAPAAIAQGETPADLADTTIAEGNGIVVANDRDDKAKS